MDLNPPIFSIEIETEMTFKPPTNCPSCDSTLEWRKDQLYCVNSQCPAISSKTVEHFAKTLKIKGLGPSSINQLGWTHISDIYTLEVDLPSEKISEKLKAEINKSKERPFNEVLPALGIPLVGKSAAGKLATVCDSIFDINEETCRQAGLGAKTISNLLDWFAANLDWFLELPLNVFFEETTQVADKGTICITGKLKSFKTKAEAQKFLEERGWKVVSSVTKAVTHLVNESGVETAKTKKAADSGIIIVNDIMEIIE